MQRERKNKKYDASQKNSKALPVRCPDIQIESSGKDTVVFETEHGVLQNLTMRQRCVCVCVCVCVCMCVRDIESERERESARARLLCSVLRCVFVHFCVFVHVRVLATSVRTIYAAMYADLSPFNSRALSLIPHPFLPHTRQ